MGQLNRSDREDREVVEDPIPPDLLMGLAPEIPGVDVIVQIVMEKLAGAKAKSDLTLEKRAA